MSTTTSTHGTYFPNSRDMSIMIFHMTDPHKKNTQSHRSIKNPVKKNYLEQPANKNTLQILANKLWMQVREKGRGKGEVRCRADVHSNREKIDSKDEFSVV